MWHTHTHTRTHYPSHPSPLPPKLPPCDTHTLPWWGSEQGLGQTFSWAVFLGNGLMAIAAGFIGDGLVERAGLGRVAPFDAAIVAMLAGGA